MTTTLTERAGQREARTPTPRRYLLCRPTHFEVAYAINPWMDPSKPVDREVALAQWEELRSTYLRLGHRVHVVEGVAGLPDMVFAANAALVIDGKALRARFRNAERAPESAIFAASLRDLLSESHEPAHVNEGEGDFLAAGELILAGTGFRTEPAAHREAQEYFGRPVVSLQLTDPRYYHLDTALAVLDGSTIAYYPPAFSPGSRRALRRLFPDAIEASDHDAETFGLNAVSDGYHVLLSAEATDLAGALRERGYEPVPVNLSEFRKAGGGAKCCTLEIRT